MSLRPFSFSSMSNFFLFLQAMVLILLLLTFSAVTGNELEHFVTPKLLVVIPTYNRPVEHLNLVCASYSKMPAVVEIQLLRTGTLNLTEIVQTHPKVTVHPIENDLRLRFFPQNTSRFRWDGP